MKPHPSGRPIRKTEQRGRPMWRIPDDGYVTPRLQRRKNQTQAIGFTAGRYDEADEEGWHEPPRNGHTTPPNT